MDIWYNNVNEIVSTNFLLILEFYVTVKMRMFRKIMLIQIIMDIFYIAHKGFIKLVYLNVPKTQVMSLI